MIYKGIVGAFGVLYGRFKLKREAKGLLSACVYVFQLMLAVALSPLYSMVRSKKTFHFCGRMYHYFCHWYNTTFDNERAIEIPIMLEAVKTAQMKHGNILEVGNVLSHYSTFEHDILDKYEKGEDVIHEDVVDFSPKKKYNLIISISTMEHVGWDEDPRDPTKIPRAIQHLLSLLEAGGTMIFTIPVGYNPHMDALVREEKFMPEQYYFRRVSKNNVWEETTKKVALACLYGSPYPFGNATVIGVLKQSLS